MNGDLLLRLGVTAVAYLLGSVSFATLIVKLFHGADVRHLGSGNAGATNVFRSAGGRLAAATLLLDVAKGAAAVYAMKLVTPDPSWTGAAGVAAVVGHVFPVWFAFAGGKGAATAFGAFALLAPWAAISVAVVFGLVVATTRLVSLGSVTAASLLPMASGLVFGSPDAVVVAAAATTLLLLVAHRKNIARLFAGTERKLGDEEDREE